MSLEEPAKDSPAQSSPANLFRKQPASERKIQANRRNALRSTGPKTERGKRTVARNAIKHGILAREVVITAGDGKESSEEFHALVGQLWEEYEPVGVVEESLVQRIAACWWRTARVLRAENGEIRKRLDTLAMDRALRNSDNANRDLAFSQMAGLDLYRIEHQGYQRSSLTNRWSAMQVAQSDLRNHLSGLAKLSALLQKAKSEVARDGCISEETGKEIFHAFYFWDYSFALICRYAGRPEAKIEDRPSEKAVGEQTDRKRAAFVSFIDESIDQRLEKISTLEHDVKKRESLTADAEARSFSLPPADATDKLLRYEAHLDRQLYRAMDQLERFQRQRRGENVPPPININLGRRR
ncbi:MAG TPA: hypothetical protein VK302_11160 [Terriglobales bacterium]|nr:hypothetical protein [Terriglobales bacterium]